MTKLNLIPNQRVIFYDSALKSAQYLNLNFDKAKRSESEGMAVSKFLKELVTGSPEKKLHEKQAVETLQSIVWSCSF